MSGEKRKKSVESVACCGCEIWILKGEKQRKLLKLQNRLRTSDTESRLQNISKTNISYKIQEEQSVSDRIQRRQLNWYGQTWSLAEEDLPMGSAL